MTERQPLALSPYTIEQFGGLNLVTDPADVGAVHAVAMSNVDLSPGQMQTRPGYSLVTSVASTIAPLSLVYFISGVGDYLVATTNTAVTTPYLRATGVAGTTVASAAASPNSFAMAVIGGTRKLFLANISAGTYAYDGTNWTLQAAVPTADLLAFTPLSTRLAAAANSASRVSFSDAGVPGTFGANNWVDLAPTDGDGITALVPWRDQLFAFKNTKFFSFGTESVDSGGNPVFNYRSVDVHRGCTYGAAVAGDEGVYFSDGTGIYLTAGDAPRYLSRVLEPWLTGAATFSALPTFVIGSARLQYFSRRLYVTDPDNGTTLVYDPQLDAWMIWSIGATGFASNGPDLYFGLLASKKIAHVTGTTDNGSNISWSYTSGFYPVSDPGRVAVIQESSLTGYSTTGNTTLDMSTDSEGTVFGATVHIGTSGTPAEGWLLQDHEGKLFQHTISSVIPATISRVTHYVSFVKPAGIQ